MNCGLQIADCGFEEARLCNTAHECREALECGGLTPLWLFARETSGVLLVSQSRRARATVRAAAVRRPTRFLPKAKAPSSRRTPKAGATLMLQLVTGPNPQSAIRNLQ